MAQDPIINLVEALGTNQVLCRQMAAAKSLEEKARVASQNGFNVTAQDLKGLRAVIEKGPGNKELSDADLNLAAGGSISIFPALVQVLEKAAVKVAGGVAKALEAVKDALT